jgi:hypothetical protein
MATAYKFPADELDVLWLKVVECEKAYFLAMNAWRKNRDAK